VRGFGLAEERRRDKRRFHSLAGDHQHDEQEDRDPRAATVALDRRLELRTDIAAHVLGRLEHVDHHRDHQYGGDQGQNALRERRYGFLR
jgi:hypothetical protein